MDFSYSPRTQALQTRLNAFMVEHVYPAEARYFAEIEANTQAGKRWTPLQVIEELKPKARAAGLWNLFLPPTADGSHVQAGRQGDTEFTFGLSNQDYAPLAEIMGAVPWASEVFNCSAPDTGNMEVLERVGTPAQKERWLKPLLAGEIRSAYAMTEVHHASSDAKNIATTAVLDGDDWVINGEKHYISGAGSPRCKILITMVRTNPEAAAHSQQSMILVPKDTPGVKIVGAMHVFGEDHAPHGHMHIKFKNVRVPQSNMLLGEGRGFEISQLRLGPGRIHHCMRSIGAAEKALDLMVRRGLSRKAFGKQLVWLGGNIEIISRARIEIESMRLMVLKAAKAMDVMGNREARQWVHMVKAMVPERVCQIIDQAIQMHGALGVSQHTPLAHMYAQQRTLRLADGPDEVHHLVVGRHELGLHPAHTDDAEDAALSASFRS